MTTSKPEFSILIVTYNSAEYITGCLQSIISQNLSDIEIVVVDNFSKDDTGSIIKSKFPQVKYFQNSANLGFAKAVNESMKHLNGKYILLLNPDLIVGKDFFYRIYNLLKDKGEIDILGVKLLEENGEVQPSSWKKISLLTVLTEMLLPYQISKKLVTIVPKNFSEVENVSGACMLIRKEVFHSLNGFDENFFLYYEEIDFCRRAKKLGYKIFYIPDIEAIHFGSKSTSNDRQIFFENLYKNKLYFIKKHFGKLFYATSYFIVITGILLRIIFGFIFGFVFFNRNLIRISQSLILVLIKLIKNNA